MGGCTRLIPTLCSCLTIVMLLGSIFMSWYKITQDTELVKSDITFTLRANINTKATVGDKSVDDDVFMKGQLRILYLAMIIVVIICVVFAALAALGTLLIILDTDIINAITDCIPFVPSPRKLASCFTLMATVALIAAMVYFGSKHADALWDHHLEYVKDEGGTTPAESERINYYKTFSGTEGGTKSANSTQVLNPDLKWGPDAGFGMFVFSALIMGVMTVVLCCCGDEETEVEEITSDEQLQPKEEPFMEKKPVEKEGAEKPMEKEGAEKKPDEGELIVPPPPLVDDKKKEEEVKDTTGQEAWEKEGAEIKEGEKTALQEEREEEANKSDSDKDTPRSEAKLEEKSDDENVLEEVGEKLLGGLKGKFGF
eukprot:TRINITY_DN19126_c0_g1_i1.p1 TRINITY_DN19126_c0_g1~~TRINITY_DN19126_c0_g1_i1.p1  ORF type:complete len:370 (-),score=88.07 TRINITY_DN19126_c0_g1_i1:33-1142(-)